MFYTISKGLLWYLLALLLGFVIGYLIRSAMCNRQVARAKADRSDDAELEKLRGRVANLEPVVAERDRLRDELDACRKQADSKIGAVGAAGAGLAGGAIAGSLAGGGGELDAPSLGGVDVPSGVVGLDAPDVGVPGVDGPGVDVVEIDGPGVGVPGVDVVDVVEVDVPTADGGVDVVEMDVVEMDVPASDLDVAGVDAAGVDVAGVDAGGVDVVELDVPDAGASVDAGLAAPRADDAPSAQGFADVSSGSAPDVSGATDVLGRKIKLDDLTVVEGIGPAISKLCNGIGIHTWAELADTETSLLRTMLHDAGPRFQMHDPGTWPEQAGLLAEGRWQDFKTLTDQLDGGRRI